MISDPDPSIHPSIHPSDLSDLSLSKYDLSVMHIHWSILPSGKLSHNYMENHPSFGGFLSAQLGAPTNGHVSQARNGPTKCCAISHPSGSWPSWLWTWKKCCLRCTWALLQHVMKFHASAWLIIEIMFFHVLSPWTYWDIGTHYMKSCLIIEHCHRGRYPPDKPPQVLRLLTLDSSG